MNSRPEFQIEIAAKNTIGRKEKGRSGDPSRPVALPQAGLRLTPASLRFLAFFAANFSFLGLTALLVAFCGMRAAAASAPKPNILLELIRK